jgi:uncharacterized protein
MPAICMKPLNHGKQGLLVIDLRPEHLAEVCDLLSRHIPDAQVWAFGSRVTATASEGSDLDLVVRSPHGGAISIGRLKEAFCESNLPFTVEIHDWATIP